MGIDPTTAHLAPHLVEFGRDLVIAVLAHTIVLAGHHQLRRRMPPKEGAV